MENENQQLLKKLKNDEDDEEDDDEEYQDSGGSSGDEAKLSSKSPSALSDSLNKLRQKVKVKSKSQQLELLDESIAQQATSSSSSSDNSFESPSTPTQKSAPSSHYCGYFNHDSSEPAQLSSSGCKHPIVVGQNVCLKCEFGRELSDSLDHMAFFSPEKSAQCHMEKDKFGFDVINIQG